MKQAIQQLSIENVALIPDITISDLASEHRRGLVSMLTNLCGDPYRAEDLAHNALIIVIRKLKSGDVREPKRITQYLYSTARFLHFGWYRRADNQLEFRESMEGLEVEIDNSEDAIEAAQRADLIRHSLQKLQQTRDREILTRSYLNGQTKQEICDALDLSTQHYDRVIYRAKNRLRTIVEAEQLEAVCD